jgi:hypothetical protein
MTSSLPIQRCTVTLGYGDYQINQSTHFCPWQDFWALGLKFVSEIRDLGQNTSFKNEANCSSFTIHRARNAFQRQTLAYWAYLRVNKKNTAPGA